MKHLFVPYELALKLKEKGFGETCLAGYLIADDCQFCVYGIDTNHEELVIDHNNWLNAPLYQQVTDWFDKQNISIWISPDYSGNIKRKNKIVYGWDIDTKNYTDNQGGFHTYYEALNKAIEEALKLI